MTNTVTSNNIASILRSYGVGAFIARRAAQALDAANYAPSQVRTALRVGGVNHPHIAPFIAEGTK